MSHAPLPFEVLVIDPAADQCDLARFTLAAAGVSVLVAHDGLRGAAMVRDHQPDAVISELVLPGIDGFTLLERVQASRWTSGIPVVIWTASAQAELTTRASLLGAAAVVHKPSSPDRLLEAIETLRCDVDPVVRHERRLREVLLSLRRIARHYSPEPQARERLSSLINRLQEAVLMFDDDGRTVAAGTLTVALQDASGTLARMCAAQHLSDGGDEPGFCTVRHTATTLAGMPDRRRGGTVRPTAICVPSGIAGLHFAALLVA